MGDLTFRLVTPDQPYSFSFLAGALFLKESIAVAAFLAEGHDWDQLAEAANEQNLLRQRTEASRVRLLREIRHRLREFSANEIDFFARAGASDQRQLLFIALCLRFRFIREFVDEVLRPKALAMDMQLYPADFARFFDRKGAEDPEIEHLTDKSKAKVKQVLIRMLAEAGLIDSTKSQRLQSVFPSQVLARLISETDPKRLRFLLLPDASIRQYIS